MDFTSFLRIEKHVEDPAVQTASTTGVKMSYIFHKIKSVGFVDKFILVAQFEDGICKIYDLKKLAENVPVFQSLLNSPELLKKVHIAGSGFGIVWNDEFDLSCNEIWENGKPISTPFDNFLGLSDATELWDLNESTLRKAISYGKLKVGLDVCNYGKQWVVTKQAMIREYGEPRLYRKNQENEESLEVAEKAPIYGKG